MGSSAREAGECWHHAGCQYQVVEGGRGVIVEQDLLASPVHAHDPAHAEGDRRVAAQQRPDRPGDLRGGDEAGGDLEQQRRERRVVVRVDQLHRHRRAGQGADRGEPGHAGPDNDNMRPGRFIRCVHGPSSQTAGLGLSSGVFLQWARLLRSPVEPNVLPRGPGSQIVPGTAGGDDLGPYPC